MKRVVALCANEGSYLLKSIRVNNFNIKPEASKQVKDIVDFKSNNVQNVCNVYNNMKQIKTFVDSKNYNGNYNDFKSEDYNNFKQENGDTSYNKLLFLGGIITYLTYDKKIAHNADNTQELKNKLEDFLTKAAKANRRERERYIEKFAQQLSKEDPSVSASETKKRFKEFCEDIIEGIKSVKKVVIEATDLILTICNSLGTILVLSHRY